MAMIGRPACGRASCGFGGAGGGLQERRCDAVDGGSRVNRDNWNALLRDYKPGDRVTIQVHRFRREVDVVLELRVRISFSISWRKFLEHPTLARCEIPG